MQYRWKAFRLIRNKLCSPVSTRHEWQIGEKYSITKRVRLVRCAVGFHVCDYFYQALSWATTDNKYSYMGVVEVSGDCKTDSFNTKYSPYGKEIHRHARLVELFKLQKKDLAAIKNIFDKINGRVVRGKYITNWMPEEWMYTKKVTNKAYPEFDAEVYKYLSLNCKVEQ